MEEEGFTARIEQEQQARQEACRILVVDENAGKQAVRKAYRQACLKHHPDRNPNDANAHKRFLLVQCAYELLTKGTICKMLLEKMESESPAPPTTPYNLDNTWGMFLWWREKFFDGF